MLMLLDRPQPINVHAGAADEELKAKVGREGARTIPGRPEHGGISVPLFPFLPPSADILSPTGNCDIKNLSRVLPPPAPPPHPLPPPPPN